MSESTEPTETSKELKEHLNEPSPELEAEAKEKEIEHLSHEELLNLLLSADKTIKQKDGKIKAYEALIGTLITSVADEKAKIGQLKREKEGMEEVNQQMVERIEKMKEALIEGAEVITRQGMIIEHFRDVVIERPRRRERRDDNPSCSIL